MVLYTINKIEDEECYLESGVIHLNKGLIEDEECYLESGVIHL